MKEKKEKAKFDYTWIIIGVSFLMVMTSLGFCNSVKGSFLKPVTEHLGIDRFSYSFIDSIRYVATTVINVFFGALVAKFGARILIACGFSALVISQLIFAFSSHIIFFYIGGVFLGIGISFTTTTIVGYTINRWCSKKKGTVMGGVLAASGLGGAIAAQVVTPIISNSGYKTAYIVIAVILAVVGIIVVSLFRNQPKDFEPNADRLDQPKKKSGSKEWTGIELSDAMKTWYFYGAVFVIFLAGVLLQAANTIWQAHSSDVGIDDAYIGIVLSISSITLALFKFLTGFFNDKFGMRVTCTLCTLVGAAVMIILAFASGSIVGKIFVMIYGIFISLSFPLETVMLSIYAKGLFGERSFDYILGIFASANTAGCALGGPIINLFYENVGNYKLALIAAGVLMVASSIIMQFIITAAGKCRKKVELSEKAEVKADV